MFKWGYAYLKEGRQVVVAIAAYINKGRYTTSSVVNHLPSLDHIQSVLELHLPVKRTPDMTQLEFRKAFSRIVSRSVYIYDNEVLMNDKPYTSYAFFCFSKKAHKKLLEFLSAPAGGKSC